MEAMVPGLELGAVTGWLAQYVFAMLRIGAFVIASPGFGGRFVPAQVRVMAVAVLALPVMAGGIEGGVALPDPAVLAGLGAVRLVFTEITLGLVAGMVLTILFGAAALAGDRIAATAGLGFAAQAQDLTVMSWGGAYGESQLEAYIKPFMAETGKNVVAVDADNPATPVKAMVEAKNVTVDVADVEYADAVRMCDEGLLEEMDHAALPAAPDGTAASDDFLPGALTDCGVANIVFSTVFAFDTTKFPTAPTSIADFFDAEKFPGKRGMRKGAKANLEMALMADGVPAADVYAMLATPEGVDRADILAPAQDTARLRLLQVTEGGFRAGTDDYWGGWRHEVIDCDARTIRHAGFASIRAGGLEGPLTGAPRPPVPIPQGSADEADRKSTRLNSSHT